MFYDSKEEIEKKLRKYNEKIKNNFNIILLNGEVIASDSYLRSSEKNLDKWEVKAAMCMNLGKACATVKI